MNNLKTTILALCLTLTSIIPCIAQNAEQADSSINVIAYFSKNDTVTYKETNYNYKIVGNDTTIQSAISEEIMLIVIVGRSSDYNEFCVCICKSLVCGRCLVKLTLTFTRFLADGMFGTSFASCKSWCRT